MPEEPDAADSSPEEEPGDRSPADGDDSVDSGDEPDVERPEGEGSTGDAGDSDQAAAEGFTGDGGPPEEGGSGGEAAGAETTAGDEPQTGADEGAASAEDGATGGDEEGATEDASEPIGAVTDATSPPSESAPGVDDGRDAVAGEELPEPPDVPPTGTDAEEGAADGEPAVDGPAHDEAMPVDADVEDGEAVDPSAVNHGAPPDAVGEGPLQPAEEPGPSGAAERARREGSDPGEPAAADAASAGDEAAAGSPAPAPAGEGEPVYPEGPPDDEEMPLADHVEEMVLRLAVVCGIATVVAGTVFFFEPLAENMIMFIWNAVIPWESPVPETVAGAAHPVHFVGETAVSTNPRVYGPLELKLTELKFASLVGFVLALPVFVYESYRFMRPGLYPHERRYYLAAVPTSLVLAFVGVSFAYFIILPAIFAYFIRYSRPAGALAFALRSTFDLILALMGYMAVVFQIPLLIMLAIMIGVTDRAWLEDRRLYFWGGFLGVAFMFVPEPTGMAPILVALTMIGLFEGTLALLRWTGN